MLLKFWSRLTNRSTKPTGKHSALAEMLLEEDIEDVDDDDDEKTIMVDTLAYHQPPKHAVAEKARQLAEGTNI